MDLDDVTAVQPRSNDERLKRIADLIGCTPTDLKAQSSLAGEAVELLRLFQLLGTDKERQAALAFVRRLAGE